MAEFAKVAHEWVRMCNAFSDKAECKKCPMVTNPMCGCMSDGNGASEKEIAKAEADIMSWAAEHPEPVYPTWYAWLANMCVVPIELPPDQAIMVTDIGLLKKIPAYIAEKLGIEPKEG